MVAAWRWGRSARIWRADLILVLVLVAFAILGLVMVKSASYGFALLEGEYEGRPDYFFQRQAMFMGAGALVLVVISRLHYRLWARFALPIMGLSLFSLVLLLLIGQEHQSTMRWLLRGSIQPVEFAKLGTMIYIAAWLASRGEQLRATGPGLLAFALLLGVVSGLILMQPDFSTVVILVLTATTMLFAAGASMRQMLILLGVGLVASYAMIRVASYRNARLMLWLEGPFSDPSGEGMQLVQALYALDRGGWLGVGLGHSQQKFTVYAPHTDGIFAILCEEMGVIGALAVVGLYGLWTWRGLRIAWYARDVYGRVLAVGLTAWVVFQAAVHVGVLTATIPFTGTVLPFISYGGSSLSSSILSAGLLLSISRDAGAPEEEHAS